MVRQLNTSIETLDVATSLQYAEAYLHPGAGARPLMQVLAPATSKTQDNPHHHRIVCTAIRVYAEHLSPGGCVATNGLYLALRRTLPVRVLRVIYQILSRIGSIHAQ
jgi:hypothetical protein